LLQDHAETGGAARAAGRFASGLRQRGVEVAVAAGDQGAGKGHFLVTGKPKRGWGRVRELWQGKARNLESRRDRAQRGWKKAIQEFQPDLIWIHNLQGAFKWGWSLGLVEQALASASLLWTLHDMWALGDGPSYFPEEELPRRRDRSPLAQLRSSMSQRRCTLLAPSVWLRDLVRSSGLGRCEAWPNPLDIGIFQPESRAKTRQELGLGEDEVLLMAAAENLADPRKGIDCLAAAWPSWSKPKTTRLGLMGRNCPGELKKDPNVLAFGPVTSEARVAELMAAADLFLHPAKVESYGLVLEEAQACGTPVLAAKAGGVGETFVEGLTGWSMETTGPEALARQLNDLLARPEQLRAMRTAAREAMEQKHRPEMFSARWDEIQGILGR